MTVSVTSQLTEWIQGLQLAQVPQYVKDRTKALLMDGLACALLGSHLPWSETATRTMVDFESSGPCSVWGWTEKLGPLSAVVLNSSFVQGFELDDFHRVAPVHGVSIVLPALMGVVELEAAKGRKISGSEFLLAAIVGLEVCPRIGAGLGGKDLLSRGIHSGALMGPIGAAAASAKLLNLSAIQIEHAIGTAATQSSGLMSAQAGSMVKRMQHGFAVRNGLCAALLARGGYTGIEQVLDVPYGGFFAVWTAGSRKEPQSQPNAVVSDLGQVWYIMDYVVKQHATMGANHTPVECFAALQASEPRVNKADEIANIHIEVADAAYHHGCFPLPTSPLSSTAAQMCMGYAIACQLLDKQVFVEQFAHDKLDRPEVRRIVDHITYENASDIQSFKSRIKVTFTDGQQVRQELSAAKAIHPGLSDADIREKAGAILALVVDSDSRGKIESMLTSLDMVQDCTDLALLLQRNIVCPI